jgi:phage tail-like protein
MEPKFSYYLPPSGIHFLVSGLLDKKEEQIGFQSVSGLSAEVVTESYKEGGQNEYEYKLPLRAQYPDLVLKRGLWIPGPPTEVNADLKSWFNTTLESLIVQPRNITISLMNIALDKPIMTWYVHNAWPKKWSITDLNAEDNQIVIETLECHYSKFKLTWQ